MRRGTIVVLGLLAAGATFPASVEARPRGLPGAIFGFVTNPIGSILGGMGPRAQRRAYHRRAAASRTRDVAPAAATVGAATAATAGAATAATSSNIGVAALNPPSEQPEQRGNESPQTALPSQRSSDTTQLGLVGPAAWPKAYEDVLGFTLWPASYEGQIRAHGIGDVMSTIFTSATAFASGRRTDVARARSDDPSAADQDVGAVGNCGTLSSAAEWPMKQIEQTIQLSEPQRAALDQLRVAVNSAIATIKATCRDDAMATPIERLKVMQDMLWAVHDAALLIRAPLQRFYDSLTDEQKKQFVVQMPTETRGRGTSSRAMSRQEFARMCGAPSMAEWPIRKIEQALRPSKAQRASLETLQKKSTEMAQLLMASCLQVIPATPPARLETASDRLTAVIFAASTVALALNDFYGQLSNEQKAQFNSLSN